MSGPEAGMGPDETAVETPVLAPDAFAGKTCVVTGGGSGIGREVCHVLAGAGGSVIAIDVNGEDAAAAAAALPVRDDAEHEAIALDITDREAVRRAAAGIAASRSQVDVLVNCAAIAAPEHITGKFVEMPEERWRPLLEVNFVGHVHVLQALLPSMLDLPGGAAVVNVISDSYLGYDRELAIYGAGKAALASLTRTLARELGGQGVRVNGVSPSATRTPSTERFFDRYEERITRSYPLRRLGTPRDQANVIAFMASEGAAWVTGQIVSVNGGYL